MAQMTGFEATLYTTGYRFWGGRQKNLLVLSIIDLGFDENPCVASAIGSRCDIVFFFVFSSLPISSVDMVYYGASSPV